VSTEAVCGSIARIISPRAPYPPDAPGRARFHVRKRAGVRLVKGNISGEIAAPKRSTAQCRLATDRFGVFFKLVSGPEISESSHADILAKYLKREATAARVIKASGTDADIFCRLCGTEGLSRLKPTTTQAGSLTKLATLFKRDLARRLGADHAQVPRQRGAASAYSESRALETTIRDNWKDVPRITAPREGMEFAAKRRSKKKGRLAKLHATAFESLGQSIQGHCTEP